MWLLRRKNDEEMPQLCLPIEIYMHTLDFTSLDSTHTVIKWSKIKIGDTRLVFHRCQRQPLNILRFYFSILHLCLCSIFFLLFASTFVLFIFKFPVDMHNIASNRLYLVCRRRRAMSRVGNVIGKTTHRCHSIDAPAEPNHYDKTKFSTHSHESIYIFQFVAIAFDLLKCIELGGERRVSFDTCNVVHFTFIKLRISIPFESIFERLFCNPW